MLLNLAPTNEAVLSNVGEIGEFRIRNSAKAFSILSSGLYANKIRAIIRELSCNAVDSHVAAGKQSTPFDIHLPTTLEPWFAIRDYGTGLSHEQVTNIYTTYFESTKTNSNDFIGALGLGSKSPFSYTDNFTVTAIKDGVKGIYSAFINGEGVPSIAKMGEEETTEPAGVEIKFSVNDRYDFNKFNDEARQVYTYFKLRPVISGIADFKFREITYETENIIPGVHTTGNHHSSVAVMGNIAYPIDIPNANDNLGPLSNLLRCGLEIHFDIGELDFQASREGLSYIPQTIASIKRKLEALNAQLAVHIAAEADAITNLWTRAIFLNKKKDTVLWQTAVTKYVTDTKFDLFNLSSGNYLRLKEFEFPVEDLAKLYNIEILAFQKTLGSKGISNLNHQSCYVKNTNNHYRAWTVPVRDGTTFVKNDTKIGASARAKYHWNNTKFDKDVPHYQTVFVLSRSDKTKPAKFDEFLKACATPEHVVFASELMQKERVSNSGGKNVTILSLQERGSGSYYAQKEMVWRDAGKADSFDDTDTHYYLPLSGYNVQSVTGATFDVKRFYNDLKNSGVKSINVDIYGVRKGDLEFIKTQKNWINIESHVTKTLASITPNELDNMALNSIDKAKIFQYNNTIADNIEHANSPFLKVMNTYKGIKEVSFSKESFERLCQRYATVINIDSLITKFVDEKTAIYERYPLLSSLDSYRLNSQAVAEYVNLIDTKKGV